MVPTKERNHSGVLLRYKSESDFEQFRDNLIIYPLDLRLLNSIDMFISYLSENFTHIDILVKLLTNISI